MTEEMEMLEDDKARLQDLVTVKERMVADERMIREELEAKMKRITSKVKSTKSSPAAIRPSGNSSSTSRG